MKRKLFSGPTGFGLVWIGQLISIFGSFMTGFALPIWVYQQTESATTLALMGVLFTTPMLLISPIAGALVDRSNRKLMMMLSDLATGLITVAYFLLFSQGMLEIWHLYLGSVIQGTFQAFQWPAYSAAISTMIPKEQNEQAAGYLAQSVEMWKQVQQNERGLAYCEQGLGLLALNRGQAGEAVEYFQQAVARCEKLVLKAELIENLSYLGQALLAGGKLEEARVHSVRAIKLLREQKDVEEEQAIYFNHYRVLKANHEAQAGEFLHQAQDSMQAQAELLNDPEERRSFLEQVRINRWIQNEK